MTHRKYYMTKTCDVLCMLLIFSMGQESRSGLVGASAADPEVDRFTEKWSFSKLHCWQCSATHRQSWSFSLAVSQWWPSLPWGGSVQYGSLVHQRHLWESLLLNCKGHHSTFSQILLLRSTAVSKTTRAWMAWSRHRGEPSWNIAYHNHFIS